MQFANKSLILFRRFNNLCLFHRKFEKILGVVQLIMLKKTYLQQNFQQHQQRIRPKNASIGFFICHLCLCVRSIQWQMRWSIAFQMYLSFKHCQMSQHHQQLSWNKQQTKDYEKLCSILFTENLLHKINKWKFKFKIFTGWHIGANDEQFKHGYQHDGGRSTSSEQWLSFKGLFSVNMNKWMHLHGGHGRTKF